MVGQGSSGLWLQVSLEPVASGAAARVKENELLYLKEVQCLEMSSR